MPVYFFTATGNAHAQITKLFDFVWPTAAAMWNLRWQVAGYLQIVPGATVAQLRARFTEGTDIHGANLQRACMDHTWDDQKEAFARILLVNTIAIYEGWIEEVLEALGKNTQTFRTQLQFPNPVGGAGSGVGAAIGALTAVESPSIKEYLYAPLSAGRYYALPKINEMLLCYRFFKELRNCDMHGGGIADQRLIDAYNRFLPVATPAALGVAEVPAFIPPIADERVRISLRGVVGFSNIVLRIIATLDAELSRSKLSEKPFLAKWKLAHPLQRMLSAKPKKRNSQIKRMANRAGFPKPSKTNKFGDWLSQGGLTQF
jgi:hypothetical protein